MSTEDPFVIIGAGLAGAKAAQTLREEGFTGRIVLVGDETDRPYERPPLSKGYLLGKDERSTIYVHDADWYRQNSVELMLGHRATRLNRGAHEVELQSGERIRYSKLLLATGASPRRPDVPGADLDGVYYLRRVQESERLRHALRGGARVVVVGAGWIGLETAAAAREYGCPVSVIEPQPAPLQAALGTEIGGYFANLHRDHDVDLRLGRNVTQIRGTAGRADAVRTDDGTDIPADVIIVGVGVGAKPNTELAEQAGLAVDNGILVDQALRTEDPDIYAAGDAANALHSFYRQRIRVEHWANALHGGPAAARSMLDQHVNDDRLPYLLTDQYDLGMEYTGWFPPGGYDTVITRGEMSQKAFQAFWLTAGKVVAGMHVNMWDDGVDPIQALIRSDTTVNPDRLADPSVPVDDLTTHVSES